MVQDHIEEFTQAFVGRTCSVERESPFWRADFGGQFTIAVRVPWRIVAKGRIMLGNEDDGQQFGLSSPLDGEQCSASLLSGRLVQALHIDRETGDLTFNFDGNTRIDVFNNSCGYEGWDAYYTVAGDRRGIVALGGGKLVAVRG